MATKSAVYEIICVRQILLNILLVFLCSEQAWATRRYYPNSASIGSFNLLRLGHDRSKKLERLVDIILQGHYHVLSAVEVMEEEAAYDLLRALQLRQDDWALNLSLSANGESSYKEYFAFYYRKKYAVEITRNGFFCDQKELALEKHRGACYARDFYTNGPDFERDPYVGQFRIGTKNFALVLAHLYYGDQNRAGVSKRQKEIMALKKIMRRIRLQRPQINVVALGDFNLTLPSASMKVAAVVPLPFFYGTPHISGYLHGPTTVGGSSYDHFFVLDDNISKVKRKSIETLRNFDTSDMLKLKKYKDEVSDHFPIKARFLLR